MYKRQLRILTATDAAEPQFACFGLHEWAMVYRQSPDQARHQVIGLRATPEEIARVVEGHEIRCSHWDAFRFFTPDARPRNVLQPDAEAQASFEQPGCLHGGAMDLYRWAFKLDPGVPGDLLLDAFELARRARVLDMRSSPYDVRPFRLTNIAIETADGKAEHVAEQRSIADAAALLRRRSVSYTHLDVYKRQPMNGASASTTMTLAAMPARPSQDKAVRSRSLPRGAGRTASRQPRASSQPRVSDEK